DDDGAEAQLIDRVDQISATAARYNNCCDHPTHERAPSPGREQTNQWRELFAPLRRHDVLLNGRKQGPPATTCQVSAGSAFRRRTPAHRGRFMSHRVLMLASRIGNLYEFATQRPCSE